jgi:aspartate-semialdehyde dehydrogenase
VRKYDLAVVGATGAVGQELLQVLAERGFPYDPESLKLLASERSAGKKINYQGREYTVEATVPDSFTGVDIVLFAGGAASKLFAREAVARGAVVIDNSSTFRYDDNVPLVVPEINPKDAAWHQGIIANPNCSTIQMVMALKPIYDAVGLKRVVVSTYQAVSGAGVEAIEELRRQSALVSQGREIQPKVFPHQIAFNLIPQIDVFLENGYTKEEMKMVWETRKILGAPELAICATAVRAPVYRSHSESVNIETIKPLSAKEAKELLAAAPGVEVLDDPEQKLYPMPYQASHSDSVYVGRIREDISCQNGLAFWVVSDQLRKGAATNAVQIAELLYKEGGKS